MINKVCLLAAYLFIIGCTTRADLYQDVDIKTEPSGYTVEMDGKRCITPCTLVDVSRMSTVMLIYADDKLVPMYLENTVSAYDPIRTIHPINLKKEDFDIEIDDNYLNKLTANVNNNIRHARAMNELNNRRKENQARFAMLLLDLGSSASNYNNQMMNSQVNYNAYGNGVHMNQYGQPVQFGPAFQGGTGYYGDSIIQTPNAYGPGIHMDQYGRPISVVPR